MRTLAGDVDDAVFDRTIRLLYVQALLAGPSPAPGERTGHARPTRSPTSSRLSARPARDPGHPMTDPDHRPQGRTVSEAIRIDELLEQVDQTPFGPEERALIDEAIALAVESGDEFSEYARACASRRRPT